VTAIRVALADDQELVRSGFAALLDAEDDICVAGLAGDGFGAVALAREQHPDVILMDIRMPGPRSGWMSTSSTRCGPGRPASWSKTPTRPS
jgi:DNA-binding NarL/FixJ family response regulator